MAYIDNPYANSLRQAQAMPAVQQALGGYEGGMDGLMRLFQQQYSRPQQQTQRYNPGEDTRQIAQRPDPASMAPRDPNEPIPQMQQDYRENYMRNYMNRPDADRISQPQMGQIDAGYNSRIGLPQRENTQLQEDMISQFNKESIARTSPAQQTPQFGGLGSMNSGGMGYGNMFRMQNERMPQYGGYGGYGGGMRPQPYQQMPQPQYQPYASPYQQQYPQPQRYGGYGRQQQYGGYGGGYGGMQNRYQPQQYGGYGGYGQQYMDSNTVVAVTVNNMAAVTDNNRVNNTAVDTANNTAAVTVTRTIIRVMVARIRINHRIHRCIKKGELNCSPLLNVFSTLGLFLLALTRLIQPT
jgi:hypothetical protein